MTTAISCTQYAQTHIDTNSPAITFEKDTIDYGTIEWGSDGYRYAKFTNTGNVPLIIKDALTSDGGTVATTSKEPIQPGQSGIIKIHRYTENPGPFMKTCTIISNANPNIKILYIKGKISPNPNPNTAH